MACQHRLHTRRRTPGDELRRTSQYIAAAPHLSVGRRRHGLRISTALLDPSLTIIAAALMPLTPGTRLGDYETTLEEDLEVQPTVGWTSSG